MSLWADCLSTGPSSSLWTLAIGKLVSFPRISPQFSYFTGMCVTGVFFCRKKGGLISCYSCHEDGLLPALDQRDIARLHSTSSLLLLALPTSETSETPVKDILRGRRGCTCSKCVGWSHFGESLCYCFGISSCAVLFFFPFIYTPFSFPLVPFHPTLFHIHVHVFPHRPVC